MPEPFTIPRVFRTEEKLLPFVQQLVFIGITTMRNAQRLFCRASENMKRLLLLSAFLLTACSAAPAQAVYPTQTPDPIQAYVDANASKGTAVAAIATAEYFSMQLTATVETRNQIATQQDFPCKPHSRQPTSSPQNAPGTPPPPQTPSTRCHRHGNRLSGRTTSDLDPTRNGHHRHRRYRISAGIRHPAIQHRA